MNSLRVIQTISKIGKIISRIVFVFSIVAVCLAAAAIVSMLWIPDGFRIGGTTIYGLVGNLTQNDEGAFYAVMAAVIILCAGEAVLAKIAERYFAHELAAGTPFTLDGAKELLRFGICAVCIPAGTTAVVGIVQQILRHFLGEIDVRNFENSVSLGFGIMLIVMSFLCRYGAELAEQNAPAPGNETPQPDV